MSKKEQSAASVGASIGASLGSRAGPVGAGIGAGFGGAVGYIAGALAPGCGTSTLLPDGGQRQAAGADTDERSSIPIDEK